MHPVARREWLVPLLLALFFVLAGSIPYLYAHQIAPSGDMFMGFVGRDTSGANAYFAFARQVAEGHNWVTNLYAPHAPSHAYFHPEWWLMGIAARLSGLSLEGVFHLGRGFTALAFLLAAYYLGAVSLPSRGARRAALLLIAFGAGFGWLIWLANHVLGAGLPLPWDIQGVSPFAYLMNKPHFMRAGAFAALQYAWFIRGDQTGRWRFFAASGLAATGHSLVRPYQIPEAMLFLVLYATARVLHDPGTVRRAAGGALLAGACHGPAILWHAWVYFRNPLGLQGFHAWQPVLLFPQMIWFGLPFAAILVHLAWRICRGGGWRPVFPVLALWMIAAMLLLQAAPYFPWGVESYFVWVLAPPVLFLRYTWPKLDAWLRCYPRPRIARRLAVAAIIVLVIPSSVFAYADFFQDLHFPDGTERHYLSRDVIAAAAWMAQQHPDAPVVLASLESSQFLPRLGDLRVLSGQDALSPRYQQMNDWVFRFYVSGGDDGYKRWLCREQDVTYVLAGPFEQAITDEDFQRHDWLEPVFTQGEVTVFQVLR